MANKRQSGFTLFELTVSAGLFAVLSAITIVSLQNYSLQARITRGLSLAAGVKAAVAEYYSRIGEFPTTEKLAGIDVEDPFADNYVKSVRIGSNPVNGTITIAYKAAGSISEGDTLLLVPAESAGQITWTCRTRTLISNLVPASCG